MAEDPKIELFIKASDDGETIGNCPFSQRLFMILWLKKVAFTINTVDMKRNPDMLKDIAPGSQLPVLIYNGDLKTDNNKIEEFLEEVLAPPKYPRLSVRYKESMTAGYSVFQKFSAYVKNPLPEKNQACETAFLKALVELDQYLNAPLPHEDGSYSSKRLFLDGNELTLADCNLLPKLHVVQVVCKHYRNFTIPKELSGLYRYLKNAEKCEEFMNTCPNEEEIKLAYRNVAKYSDRHGAKSVTGR
ncbi:chloride intracellular channel protein 4-like [Stegostoma tigrinum]|uniref:chloride intracellular channel protein 4-like n=1 Tax=Stegostoma tigrinum TaxID=3053191 RepID=UPI00202B16FC|nr:chloride intracellular channel protein 4-like [Stegostoma tigrinum]